MVILTGDTHGDFKRIEEFCEKYGTTRDDVIVVLGDAGVNYHLDKRDGELKRRLCELPVTLFCVHGNHEQRPYLIDGYVEKEWRGGIVYLQTEYPNILFAKDGEVYDFDGKKAIVIGGAYSVDINYRIFHRLPWYDSEQPDDAIKREVEQKLDALNWKVDYVFSHTVPESAMPHHAFLTDIDADSVDRSTEKWLERINRNLDYTRWYAGHFHTNCDCGKVRIIFEDYDELDGHYGFWEQ